MVHQEHLSFWLNQRAGKPIKPENYEGIRLYWAPGNIRRLRERLQQLGYEVSEIVDRDYGQTTVTPTASESPPTRRANEPVPIKRNEMSTVTGDVATHLTSIAPQFLVEDLDRAIAYYRDKLGFALDFKYESFYAAVTRDGFAIHLKCAPKLMADRDYRRQNEHLDAYISVAGIRGLFSGFEKRGAKFIKPLEHRPWACLDFYVEDPDGYILCFSEQDASAER